MTYYSAIKKAILPITTTWMNLEDVLLIKLEKDKYSSVSLHLHVEFKIIIEAK